MSLREKAEAAIAPVKPNALTPEPLPELPEVTPFDYDFMPAAIRGYVRDISERMQCPPDFAAVNTYLMFSAVIGCKIGIRPKRRDNWVIVPNLWGAVIGGSGVMKSPNRSEVLKPLKQFQIELAREVYDRNVQLMNSGEESKLRQAAKKLQARRALKDDPDADISGFLKSESDTLPQAEIAPRFITNDATAEALGQLMIENPNGILFEADELIGLLKSLDKQGQEGARAFYLTAADGNQSYTIDRIMRGTNLHIESACLSIIGGIQPGVLSEYVREALSGGAGADGLLQRFGLMVYPDISPKYEYIDRFPDKQARDIVNDLVKKLHNIDVQAIATIGEYCKTPYLHFDDSAQEVFIEWLCNLEKRLRSDEDHPAIVSHLSKYRKLVPALALINHLCDSEEKSVSESSLLRALAYCEYLESHARRVYSYGTQPGIDAAKSVLTKLKKGKLNSPFTVRDIYRKCWAGIDTPKKAEAAINVLLDYNHLAKVETFTEGRPATLLHWVQS
jgi:putative DNA primase/helicase